MDLITVTVKDHYAIEIDTIDEFKYFWDGHSLR